MSPWLLALIILILCPIVVLVIFFLILGISCLFIDMNKKYETDSAYYRWLAYFVCRMLETYSRVRLHVEGMEKIPVGSRYMMVANHVSNFDPLMLYAAMYAVDPETIYISKPENFRIIFFGKVIHRLRFLAIDRSSVSASRRVFLEASNEIINNRNSVVVYPEGTRNKGEGMLPLHSAVFIMALRAKAPVVVSTVQGTQEIHKRFPWRSTKVTIRVVDVIPAEWVTSHTLQEISDRAEELMRQDLGIAKETKEEH